MASAILDAWLKKSISPQDIYVDDPKPSEWLLEKKKQGLNINTNEDILFDYCFIGVKPQSLDEIKLKLKMLSRKNLIEHADLLKRISEWKEAYLKTPHGQPVQLESC